MGFIRKVNDHTIKPSEWQALFRALDLYESNCDTVASIHGAAFRKLHGMTDPVDHDRRELHRDVAAHARKQLKIIPGLRYKLWRLSVGLPPEKKKEGG